MGWDTKWVGVGMGWGWGPRMGFHHWGLRWGVRPMGWDGVGWGWVSYGGGTYCGDGVGMRSIMGFLPDVKEGPKGLPGLKTDFQTIPIAAQVFL